MSYRYRFNLGAAHTCGVGAIHPRRLIEGSAPDAFDVEPVPAADCWMFSTDRRIETLPPYIVLVSPTDQ